MLLCIWHILQRQIIAEVCKEMQWIVLSAGLTLLLLTAILGRQAGKNVFSSQSQQRMDVLARETIPSAYSRLKADKRLPRRMERAIRYLNRFDDVTPDAEWLCNNGRYLQEEMAVPAVFPPLPSHARGAAPRIQIFAQALINAHQGEITQKVILDAASVWQQTDAFENGEICFLSQMLHFCLCQEIAAAAETCAARQRDRQAAQRAVKLLQKGKNPKALRLMKRRKDSPAFWEEYVSLSSQKNMAQPFLTHQEIKDMAEQEHLLQSESALRTGNAIQSLRRIGRMPWDKMQEEISAVHALLRQDPVYGKMDQESRAYYRGRVARLARKFRLSEKTVCQGALDLCVTAGGDFVRGHAGYYLLDDGLPQLARRLHARPPFKHSAKWLPLLDWLVFLALLAACRRLNVALALCPLAALVGMFSFQRLAAAWLTSKTPARMVPRIQVDALDEGERTLVVCPTMLADEKHALAMVKRLSIMHQANPDKQLHFLLLGDFQDSLSGTLSTDQPIMDTASAAVDALCKDTGHPFFYLQRERVYLTADHCYGSRERKRGSLETLMRLLEGKPIQDTFACATVDPSQLTGQYRYVITLDSDTILPPGSALRLVGAMLHPLQVRQKSADGRMRGVSIVQPAMETAAHTVGSRLSMLLGGPGGTDPYNRLSADYDQDVLHRGTFMGKGIIDPKAFLDGTEGAILPGCVLSHDLLEGELAGCCRASDISLYDGHPETLSGWMSRLHRWTRGDWQLLPYAAFSRNRRLPPKLLDSISKRKIRHNLLRSLIDPMRVVLLAYGAAAGRWWLWLAALLLPDLVYLRFQRQALLSWLCRLAMLPCKAGVQADAMVRSLARMGFTHRRLLQWTPTFQASRAESRPPMVFFYLNMILGAAMGALAFWPTACPPCAISLALLWIAFPFALPLLEQPYDASSKPTGYMREVLGRLAQNTLLFFETAITDQDNALPPDNVQIEPNKGIAHRTSPTNIGLYLCSLIAAEKLRLLSPDEAAERISKTVDTLEALSKWNGHLYNWYDTRTLEPLAPAFVSSVDSGNLAVGLLCCAQGLRVLGGELSGLYSGLSARLDALAQAMDFSALYDYEADLFSIGIDTQSGAFTPSHYDLLGSESRLLSFVAIMLGQTPVKHWYRLGRKAVYLGRGHSGLLSYSGTMFEYMMPLLFLPMVKGTLLDNACRQALWAQERVKHGGVFGVSESGYYAFDPDLLYQYRAFGVPDLAQSMDIPSNAIAPYATLLAMPVGLKRCFRNLLRLQNMGLEGSMGLFEAADFSQGSAQIVRSHMAHHQGMILCAICNVLEDGYIARLFSSLPKAMAYRLLLEEKPQPVVGAVLHPLERRLHAEEGTNGFMSRDGKPLHFPVDAHLLSGGGTTLLIDAQGGGYISRAGVMLTRFHESCRIPSGIRFYLRDSQSGSYWNATDPHFCRGVRFETCQAVFTQQRYDVECELRQWVNPIDGAVIHLITLQNHTSMERMMEVCSYLEPVLVPQRDAAAHPGFHNLFLQTRRFRRFGIAARRRAAGSHIPERWLWHQLITDANLTLFRVQSDRSSFLGRGRTVYAPRALTVPISATADTLGDVIDPCMSLRGQFVLPPGGQLRFAFVTLCPGAGETPDRFADRYTTLESAAQTYEMALTRGKVLARFFHLSQREMQLFSRMVGPLAYGDQPSCFLHTQKNKPSQGGLWSMGISGDKPILLSICSEESQLEQVRQIERIQTFFQASGMQVDWVVAVPPETSGQPPRETLHDLLDKNDGVYLVDKPSVEAFQLLLSAARLVLDLSGPPIERQLDALILPPQSRPVYQTPSPARWKPVLPPAQPLWADNGYGGFTPDGDYQISLAPGRQTPAPWSMPLCSPDFGTLACDSGLVFSYHQNSCLGRLTRWPNDAVYPLGDENFFLQDPKQRLLWSVTRLPLGHGLPVRVTYAPGEAMYECGGYGIYASLQCFTDGCTGVRVLKIKNEGAEERCLIYTHVCILDASLLADADGLHAISSSSDKACSLLGVDPLPDECVILSAGSFQGLWGVAPAALCMERLTSEKGGNTALLRYSIQLKPGESRAIVTALSAERPKPLSSLERLRDEGASQRLRAVRQQWEKRLGTFVYDLPDRALSVLLGRWLPYQAQAARLWMRAGFYQAGGAIGFRDQLQDMLSLLYTQPEQVRGHLLLCAAHQFEEGDVQHWWHEARLGVRTHISDDRLFLPYVAVLYAQCTGETEIWDEQIPYLKGKTLAPDERDRYFSPERSDLEETFFKHCLRAIDSIQDGVHGLPLMEGGDWNDGMDQVGGESVWLAMFLCEVLRLFTPCCPAEEQNRLSKRRERYMQAIDHFAWDGGWYLRGWYQNGAALGSAQNQECRIDLLPQCWGVLCGVSRDRCATAMANAWSMLYQPDTGVLDLFTPPFDGQEQPGYIAGYLPGVRENGGQYTHAACWAVAALHQQGEDARAWELALRMLPTSHSATAQLAARYRAEPYVMAADVYDNPQQRGRGGWTWYTGSASWYIYVLLTHLLGFQKQGNRLRFRPVLPAGWEGIRLTYHYGGSTYHLRVSRDCQRAQCDGEFLQDGCLILQDDGRIHEAVFPMRSGG